MKERKESKVSRKTKGTNLTLVPGTLGMQDDVPGSGLCLACVSTITAEL